MRRSPKLQTQTHTHALARSSPTARRSKTRAFTLIELMIVVVIMAILAAVVAPVIIARATRDPGADQPATELQQSPPLLAAFVEGGAGVAPRMRASDVQIKLTHAPVLVGQTVRSRYVAAFLGTFDVENVDPRAERVALHFPFPQGMNEARRVSLRLRAPDGALAEPDGVRYGLDGIRWDGFVSPGASVTVVVAYELIGQDAFSYAVASEGRTGRVRVTIDVEGPGAPKVPSTSLEPTTIEPTRFTWDVAELVANRPIVVELPPGSSPLGRLVLLLRYAALAVLLFGAGFWYLSEGDQPGRLDSFRFPHFLLLAVNYSMFFAALGVVLLVLSTPMALLSAALVSFPLLGLHVARVTSLRFALLRALPLAAYTLATVIAAVFLEAQRPIVFLGATVLAIGWVTVTYRAWDDGRKRHQKDKSARREREGRIFAAEAALAKLVTAIERAEELSAPTVGADLWSDAEGVEVVRARRVVDAARARLVRATVEARVFRARVTGEGLDVEDAGVKRVERAATEHAALLEGLTHDVDAASRALTEVIVRARARADEVAVPPARVEAHLHCMACGATVDGAAHFCGRCGAERPRVLACGACGSAMRVPAQLVKKRACALCCEVCGTALPPGSFEGSERIDSDAGQNRRGSP